MNAYRFGIALLASLPLATMAGAQWHALNHQPTFTQGAGQALLLTDGSVLVHNETARAAGHPERDWKRLIPDQTGSYRNGTWVNAGSLQAGYGPLYFASAVLADGRVVIIGGEYNLTFGGVETNQGAIYDPVANTWAPLTPPAGWSTIGDSASCVLPNGGFMLGRYNTMEQAILNPVSLAWTTTGTGKADGNSEEGWTLLRDGTMLTVDCQNGNHTEKYIISTGNWVSAGNTPVTLPAGDPGYVPEIGAGILMYDGRCVFFGASGHNAIYTTPANPLDPGSWAAVDDFPNVGGQLDVADGPACLMPNGKVLCAASPGIYNAPTHFFEFDGLHFSAVAATPNAGNISCFQGRMLLLPTGEVMFTDGTNDVEIYTPTGVTSPSWMPTITNYPATIGAGSSGTITGTQFNGLSEAVGYGDDAAASTNYPLVRITNTISGHVVYCRTHDHSTMGVATGSAIVSTHFDVPASIESGASLLVVVANGIPSTAVPITIGNDTTPPTTIAQLSGLAGNAGWYRGPVTVTLSATDPDGAADVAATYYTVDGGSTQTYSAPFVVSGDLIHTITYWSVDQANNEETPHNSLNIKIDGTNPTASFGALNPAANGYGWNNTAVDVPYTTNDNLSGVFSASPGSPVHFGSEGQNQTQTVTVTDVAGNSHGYASPSVNIDWTPPVTTRNLSGLAGNNGWWRGPVTVTLNATDNLSGVRITCYTVDGGSTQTYGTPFVVSGDGVHTVTYWSVDYADNEETPHNSVSISIDTTPPVITGTPSTTILWPPNNKLMSVTVTGSITDALSGVDTATPAYRVYDEYGAVQPSGSITLNGDGTYSFSVMLQSSRRGNDLDGRTYRIVISASDLAGNPATYEIVITVPHDQGGG